MRPALSLMVKRRIGRAPKAAPAGAIAAINRGRPALRDEGGLHRASAEAQDMRGESGRKSTTATAVAEALTFFPCHRTPGTAPAKSSAQATASASPPHDQCRSRPGNPRRVNLGSGWSCLLLDSSGQWPASGEKTREGEPATHQGRHLCPYRTPERDERSA